MLSTPPTSLQNLQNLGGIFVKFAALGAYVSLEEREGKWNSSASSRRGCNTRGYVVGSGRCGTKSIACCLGGLHEPQPRIEQQATDYYLGRFESVRELVRRLSVRAALDSPAVSDYKQSYVIPLILEVDPTAQFIVLVRDPLSTIESFVRRRWYRGGSNRQADRCRLRPPTGFPSSWTHVMKNAWLWMETYRVIFTTLGTMGYALLYTEELGDSVLHAGPADAPALELTARESEFINDYVDPFWKQIRWLKQEKHPDDYQRVRRLFVPPEERRTARKDFRGKSEGEADRQGERAVDLERIRKPHAGWKPTPRGETLEGREGTGTFCSEDSAK